MAQIRSDNYWLQYIAQNGITPAQLALKVNKAGDTMTGRLGNATSNLSTSNTRGGKEILFGATAVGNFGVLNNTDGIEIFNVMSDGSGIRLGTSIGLAILKGTGFPNGVVSAPVGSIYIDTAITNGASSWIKKSGTGNTGWQVLEGDTGWRDVTSSLINGWTASSVLIRRTGSDVSLRVDALSASGMTAIGFLASITGFNVSSFASPLSANSERQFLTTATNPAAVWRATNSTSGSTNQWQIQGATTGLATLYGTINFSTNDAWPSTLPGVSA